MKFCFGVAVVCLLASGLVQAQERSAAGSVDTQMTWSALKGLVDAANAKSDGALEQLAKVSECGKKGMVYAPGTGSADGCMVVKAAPLSCQTTITALSSRAGSTCPADSTKVLKDFAVVNSGRSSGRDANALQNQSGSATYGCQKIVCQ